MATSSTGGDPAPVSLPQQRARRLRVLIADDNEINRRRLRETLAGQGHETEEVSDGVEALEKLRSGKFDAVISDVLMPRMDGYRLSYEVRRSEELRDTRIIIYSSTYSSIADKRLARKVGVDRFLPEPVPARVILRALEDVARAPRKRPDLASPVTELESVREYSERLVHRLEETNLKLGTSNRRLNRANEALRAAGERGQADASERKSLEDQLRQAQKMEAVGRLAGGVAHDFNNLLTVILGYSHTVKDELPADHPIQREVEEIRKAGEQAAGLTRQLLAFSRKQVLLPQVLDVIAVVANMEMMLRRVIGEDIDLRTFSDPATGRIRADRGQLEQVIMNLAVNARDAMAKGGKITIETLNVEFDDASARGEVASHPGSYVMVAVSDTGAGMDADTKSHIFEPFFTTKEKGTGTGLGLATVYGIVKQSGGFVYVYSEPGHGTTFKIYLPRVEEEPDAPGRVAPITKSTRGSETLLLVEDEEAVRRLAREVLLRQGYRVLEADGWPSGLEIAATHPDPIHLVVTDVVMPGMTGPEGVSRVSVLRPGIKVLYMSGYTDDALIHRGVLGTEVALLQKPFTPGDLARRVRDCSTRREAGP
jgi:two-component system cell cycle sensor histidine kinase/response regulator CckA